MLSENDLKTIKELSPHYNRDIVADLLYLQEHPRITDINYRAPREDLGHTRHYIVFETDDQYFYNYSDNARSNIGKFEIHVPIEKMSGLAHGFPEDPNEPDQLKKTSYTSTGWGGGIIMKGEKKMQMPDYTGEGVGLPSYHPHIYGNGTRLCLGQFYPHIIVAKDTDLVSFMDHTFKFLRQGGSVGDDGKQSVSMYSKCVKHIFERNSEPYESKLPTPATRRRRKKEELLADIDALLSVD